MTGDYLASVIKPFRYYKQLGDKTFAQLTDEKLFWKYNSESNSVATIVKHLSGNMFSRWTDFLTTDGEKEWRDRDSEFEEDIRTREEMIGIWEKGWKCLFNALELLTDDDLGKTVYIRNQGQTVTDAINRQLAHYSYHVGQIVYIGKMAADKWNTLSIAKGNSAKYNEAKFSKPRETKHFTDEDTEGK